MLTNEQADETYQQAFAALHSAVIDPLSTPSQQALAREKRDMLTLEFIGQAIASVEERTRRFRTFIDEMNTVIAAFGAGSTIAGIRRLQGIVDAAGGLIGAALAPLAPAATAKKATRKPARRPAKKAVKKALKKAKTKAARKPARKATKKAGRKSPSKAVKKGTKKAAKRTARTKTRGR